MKIKVPVGRSKWGGYGRSADVVLERLKERSRETKEEGGSNLLVPQAEWSHKQRDREERKGALSTGCGQPVTQKGKRGEGGWRRQGWPACQRDEEGEGRWAEGRRGNGLNSGLAAQKRKGVFFF